MILCYSSKMPGVCLLMIVYQSDRRKSIEKPDLYFYVEVEIDSFKLFENTQEHLSPSVSELLFHS